METRTAGVRDGGLGVGPLSGIGIAHIDSEPRHTNEGHAPGTY